MKKALPLRQNFHLAFIKCIFTKGLSFMFKMIFRKLYNVIKAAIINVSRKNVSIGKGTMITAGWELTFAKTSDVQIGNKVLTDGYGRFIASNGAALSIGDNCYFNMNCFIGALKNVTIGNNCLFGPGVVIIDNDHEFKKNLGISSGKYKTGEIVIGKDCWFGANAVILRNTHIGNGCVIGAGCVVKGNIPDNTIITNNQNLHMHQIEDR